IQVSTQNIPWKKQMNHIRRAGVSSFGFSATNCHCIVEEYVPPASTQTPKQNLRPNHILTLSAKTESSFLKLIERYSNLNISYSLSDVCYTSNVGRVHFDSFRLAVTGNQMDIMKQNLTKILEEYKKTSKIQ